MAKRKPEPAPRPVWAETIIGHEKPMERLRAIVRRKRVAHAYLFTGPEDVGKRSVALHFAAILLEDPRRVADGTHPHLYYVAREDGRQNIAIRQVSELQRSLVLKPLLPKPRVIVIDDADRLSEEAMNALLKTLEEPPTGCVFILVTASPAALLGTIRSRCHTVRFGPVPEEDVRAHLKSLGRPEAGLAARLTGGRIGRAITTDITEAREKLDATLENILKQNVNAIVESLAKIRNPQKSREEAMLTMDLILLAFREVYRARLEKRDPDSNLVPTAAAEAFAELSEDDLVERMDLLLEHRHYLDLNANVGLTIENALIRI